MKFTKTDSLGSRWLPNGSAPGVLLARSLTIIQTSTNVITLIHERFEESLCVLEYLYGDLYKFQWDPNSNSHNFKQKFNSTVAKISSTEYKTHKSYREWESKNREDIKLYDQAVAVFESYMRVIRANLKAQTYIKEKMPHCTKYI